MIEFSTGNIGLIDIVGMLVSVVIPILVDLVTKRLSDAKMKAITLAALASVNGFLMEFMQSTNAGNVFQVDQAIVNAVTSFMIAVAVFFGLWKPTGVSGSTGKIQQKIPGGVGKATRSEVGRADLSQVAYVLIVLGVVLAVIGALTGFPWLPGVLIALIGVVMVLIV